LGVRCGLLKLKKLFIFWRSHTRDNGNGGSKHEKEGDLQLGQVRKRAKGPGFHMIRISLVITDLIVEKKRKKGNFR